MTLAAVCLKGPHFLLHRISIRHFGCNY